MIPDKAWWQFDLSSSVRLARVEGWSALPGAGAPLFAPRLGARHVHDWSLEVRKLVVEQAPDTREK